MWCVFFQSGKSLTYIGLKLKHETENLTFKSGEFKILKKAIKFKGRWRRKQSKEALNYRRVTCIAI